MTTRSHEDYRDNIGAYVLGALPELEAEVFEKHIAGCESCRGEVQNLNVVTAAMARSVPQVEAPSSLKASLMGVVEAEAEVRDDSRVKQPRTRRRFAWLERPRFAMATAMAVLAIGVVIGVAADRSTHSTDRTIAARINRTLMPSGDAKLRV